MNTGPKYTTIPKVCKRFPAAEELAPDLVEEAIWEAKVEINRVLGAAGFPVPFASYPCTPDIIVSIAGELAAGWLAVGPQFSACTQKTPENGKLWLDNAKRRLEELAGEGVLPGVEAPDQGFGVISSGTRPGGPRSRVDEYYPYGEPCGSRLPVAHPHGYAGELWLG